MASKSRKASASRAEQRKLLKLSPFELKDKLISLASENERVSDAQMLNAGRGNPNWICTTPRDAFGTLLRFGIEESQRGVNIPDLGRMPEKDGIAKRFAAFLSANKDAPGAKLLRDSFDYGVKTLKFDADTFVHELAEGIIGCMYPVPDRMLRCTERIVHEFLIQEMCAGKPPAGKFDIFAVEGGTAAMCYIFDSLMLNHLLHRGDTIALGVPTFTPYIEIPHFDRYMFKVVNIDASKELRPDGGHTWQYTDAEIEKLADKRIKAFFLVNPSNPPSYAMRRQFDETAREACEDKAARPDHYHRRRLWHFCARVPFTDGRVAAEYHRRLLLLKAFRMHRVAARGYCRSSEQHLRQDAGQAARQRPRHAESPLQQHHARTGEAANSSTGWWRTAARSP